MVSGPGHSDQKREFTCLRTLKRIPLSEPFCVDPTAFCKYRTACPIHLLEKENKRKTDAA